MDTSQIRPEAVELLSRITRQKVNQWDLTPPVRFLAALVTVVLGVIHADGTVTEVEKRRLLTILDLFIPPDSQVRQLAHLMVRGVRESQIYAETNALQTLIAPLSESERLLLMGFAYWIAVTDGDMDGREKEYLQFITNQLEIDLRYQEVFKSSFSGQEVGDQQSITAIHSLLDPARFQLLDVVFVKAASELLAFLPAKPEHKGKRDSTTLASSYGQLKEFQKYRKQLDNLCYQVFQIVQDCNNRDFLSHTLAEEIGKVSRKLQSQRFRVAVVGEFSQGKSTLLNALLGEEIQPVRAIPCTGTVTVLKYGAHKRVVCYYKDKRTEEISFNQYQVKAAISEEAALSSVSEVTSEIEEIVFEHPDLELCRTGVEIVDSPGLNEHPDRTAITQQLIKGTDAVIFLANASRLLSQGERDLLQSLKIQLNGGKTDKPAENIFVAVNFMDLLRREKDRQDVRQRIERFVQGEKIITGENRVHFISAQAALDTILTGTQNEYLKAFQSFTQSIEKFLTVERGSLKIKQAVTQINDLIQVSLDELYKAGDILEGHLKVYRDIHEIFEKIGEISGRDAQIKFLAKQLMKEAINEINESWLEWLAGLRERLLKKSENWSSEHSGIWSRDQLVKDYASQFNQDLSTELETWIENQLKETILKKYLEIIDNTIQQELRLIESQFEKSNRSVKGKSNLNWVFYKNHEDAEKVDILGKVGLAVLGVVGMGGAVLTGGLILPAILFGLGTLTTSIGIEEVQALDAKVKSKVFEAGWQQFSESSEDIEKIREIIGKAFYEKVKQADEIIARVMSVYENSIELQEKALAKTPEQCKADKAWILQQRQELEQVQKNIEAMLPS